MQEKRNQVIDYRRRDAKSVKIVYNIKVGVSWKRGRDSMRVEREALRWSGMGQSEGRANGGRGSGGKARGGSARGERTGLLSRAEER